MQITEPQLSQNLQPPCQGDILIVDDTPDNIRFLSTILLEQGYTVRKAINGRMALTAAKTISPDLILLDINMPGMNGYEVCEKLKQDVQTESIPIIFLSALDEVEDKIRAFRTGGVDYITKPFQLEEVLVRIQNQLTIRRLQTKLQLQNGELKEALTNLQTTQSQLVQKEKMATLGQLVAGIAHEINNPVSFIVGNIKPARKYVEDLLALISLYQTEYPTPSKAIQKLEHDIDLDFIYADLQKLMDSMYVGADRIRSVILALRIFSRLGEAELKSIDIHKGLDSTLLLVQHRLNSDGKGRAIQLIKDYGALPQITCYASQMNQVFLNLLNNAVDALQSEADGESGPMAAPTIWITTEVKDSETIAIKIKDNGPGLSEEMQSRLFEPFATTNPTGGCKGLGLSTCRQIVVEMHKGRLLCHSSPGQGAEFIVEMPLQLIKS
ncbi:MAG: response regulator [Leptolyngbyaceae cyanobacterium MO_188.B28]|nr:response regulator [Leptolyngbyaceae cyanobacterium MO_188.B28]